jgi:hypothetical protein
MTKKGKRSVRSQRPSSENSSLNDNVDISVSDDKREEPTMDVPPVDPPVIPEETEEHDTELAMDIPNYDIKPAKIEPLPYRKNPPTSLQIPPKTETPSLFSLSNPLMKYGLMALSGFILIVFFLLSRKPKPPGPVIVDVTETEGGEKKSVRNSVNRVSSPRIIFGDLRKNPSLMVAPPMTPAAH